LPKKSIKTSIRLCATALALYVCLLGRVAAAQSSVIPPPAAPSPPSAADFQGGVTKGQASAQTIDLSLDDAIQRGLQSNLGIILSGTQTSGARAARLSQLQSLLPSVDFTAKEVASQVDLPAEGLRIPGFPKIIGPFGYTDVRASLTWSLIDVQSLRNYLASRHNFAAAQLSAQDARDMVVLTVGNAYLLVLANPDDPQSAPECRLLADPGWYIHEEELGDAGLTLTRTRTLGRWYDGGIYTWTGRTVWPGGGEADSGLTWDYLR